MTQLTNFDGRTYSRFWGMVICNECGARARTIEEVLHFEYCTPGESRKWEKYYNEQDLESQKRADLAYGNYNLEEGKND